MKGRIGNMDRRITIQQVATVVDGWGGQTDSWTDLYTVWAEYKPQAMTGTALTEMTDQPQFLEKATFTIRWKDIPTDGRIVYDGHIWKIIGMAEIGRKDRLQINAAKTDSTLFGDTAVNPTIGTTGKTLDELITFYTTETSGAAPQIAYPNIIHMDDIDDVGVETWGPNGYQGMLSSGALSPGPAPSNILHVAEVDTVADPQYLKTLVNNNEFGNTHRFTYDDGTEATEVYSNSSATLDNHAVLAGYTGSNPRYIIDHYTGLGWYLSAYTSGGTATSVEWYDARGLYDYYTDMQDWVDKPSTFTYGGFTDWRRPTGPEWTFGLGSVDWSSYMTGNNQSARDIYFPPLNQYSRGFGAILMLLGPTDISNESNTAAFNWFVPASQTNGGLLTGIAKGTLDARFADGTNSTYSPILCRRHYDNR